MSAFLSPRIGPAWLSLAQLGSAWLSSAQASRPSAWRNFAQFGSALLSLAPRTPAGRVRLTGCFRSVSPKSFQLGLAWLSFAQLGSAWLCLAQPASDPEAIGLAQLGSAWLSLAQPGSTRPGRSPEAYRSCALASPERGLPRGRQRRQRQRRQPGLGPEPLARSFGPPGPGRVGPGPRAPARAPGLAAGPGKGWRRGALHAP